MSDRPFVHLHCHSHYSLLDGASSIDKLLERAKDHGMNALALTDHGNLHGALQFYQKAKSLDINPIIGYEAYIAPRSRFEKDAGSMKRSNYHLTLLAKNKTGFKNLIKLSSAAYLEGFYFKPRIDKELLEEHNEGIICLSGCISSEFNRQILSGKGAEEEIEKAMDVARWFHNLFGDRYFIEIMNNNLEIQRLATNGSIEVANRLGLPLVTTSDAHYVDREDAEAQDVMLCINTGKFRTDTSRMKMEGDEFYLRPPEEMYKAFPGMEEAVARSQEIADSVDIEIELGARHFPTYEIPDERSPTDYLHDLCIEGLKKKYEDVPEMYCDGKLADVVIERLDRELGVINELGFPNYFLIVWDFVREAADLDIHTTARGSGVGAIVCYALGMSHVCPIKYDLLFERFLDPSRLEAPDIDIDFCKQRRGEIIQYVKDKYGELNVAQIGTFGTLAARAAIRDVGRAMGIPLSRVAQVIEKVPDELGIKLKDAIEKSEELNAMYENDGEIRELLDLAQKIEGLARNVGTHAAAVVIADKPLTEYVPLCRVTGKTDIITQWAMNDVENAGLLKMDFLGLGNLTILSKVEKLIEQTSGITIDPHKFPLDDKETFALLCRGETKGVFQLESGGIRDLLQRMKPDHFSDIIATAALYRPGPLEGGMVDDYVEVKHGRKEPEYLHPVLEEILAETNGVMVYQEQVMRILNRLGDIPLSNAYTCIKAISKKKLPLIAKFRQQFIDGGVGKGIPEKEVVILFEMIEKFAGYGFNKSHSTAYALIAYQTAYLKAHYPVEFMAALLTGDIPGRNFKRKDAMIEHIEDCQRMEIEVVAPDVNTSSAEFAVGDGKIFFGLCAIKSCSGAADAIAAERKENGPYTDIFDFCERLASSCNRAAIETLIKAGAMDSFGAKRRQLMEITDRAIQSGSAAAADRRAGQMSLFGGEDEAEEEKEAITLPDVDEFPDRERLSYEKEVLGYYLTSHPLAEYADTFSTYCSHTMADIGALKDKTEVILGGMISSIKTAHVRKARTENAPTKYANFDLEDMAGAIRCIMWPEDFQRMGDLVQADGIFAIRGRVDKRGGDEANLIVNELIPLEELESRYTKGLRVRIDEDEESQEKLKGLREILRGYPGETPFELAMSLSNGGRVLLRSNTLRVGIDAEMRQRIDNLLGSGNFKLLISPPKTSKGGGTNGRNKWAAKRG